MRLSNNSTVIARSVNNSTVIARSVSDEAISDMIRGLLRFTRNDKQGVVKHSRNQKEVQ